MQEQKTEEKTSESHVPHLDKAEIVAEVREIRQKNAEVISHLKQLFSQAESEKAKRDAENATVKQTAEAISATRKELNSAQEKLASMEKELEPLRQKFAPADRIKAEIQQLEYSLHTHYSPAREKEVSRTVKELEKQLKATRLIAPKLAELSQLRKTSRELHKTLSTLVRQLKEHAAKSEGYHGAMLSNFKQADNIRKELPEAFNELDEKRALLDQINAEQKEQRRKEQEEFQAQRQLQKAEQGKRMETVKQKASEIMQRFKLGESISFEELQVLQAAGIEI